MHFFMDCSWLAIVMVTFDYGGSLGVFFGCHSYQVDDFYCDVLI